MKIERNVPIPVPAPKVSRDPPPVENMEIGDSIFFPDTKRASAIGIMRTASWRAGTKMNFKTASERGGARVWRTA